MARKRKAEAEALDEENEADNEEDISIEAELYAVDKALFGRSLTNRGDVTKTLRIDSNAHAEGATARAPKQQTNMILYDQCQVGLSPTAATAVDWPAIMALASSTVEKPRTTITDDNALAKALLSLSQVGTSPRMQHAFMQHMGGIVSTQLDKQHQQATVASAAALSSARSAGASDGAAPLLIQTKEPSAQSPTGLLPPRNATTSSPPVDAHAQGAASTAVPHQPVPTLVALARQLAPTAEATQQAALANITALSQSALLAAAVLHHLQALPGAACPPAAAMTSTTGCGEAPPVPAPRGNADHGQAERAATAGAVELCSTNGVFDVAGSAVRRLRIPRCPVCRVRKSAPCGSNAAPSRCYRRNSLPGWATRDACLQVPRRSAEAGSLRRQASVAAVAAKRVVR